MKGTFPPRTKLIEWYHLAVTMAGRERHARMVQVQKWALKEFPSASPKQIWFAIEDALA
jgi:hypothetical protein